MLNVRVGDPTLDDCIGIQIDIPRFAECPQCVFGIAGRSNFPSNEHIQRKMEVEAHRIPDGHPPAWERENEAVRMIAILLQFRRQPVPGFFSVLKDHAFVSAYSLPLAAPDPIMTIANSTFFSCEVLAHLCSRQSSMTIGWAQEDDI